MTVQESCGNKRWPDSLSLRRRNSVLTFLFRQYTKNNPPTPVDMSRCRAYMDEVLYRPGDKVHFVLKWSSHQGRWQCVAADYKSQQESHPPHSRFNVWTSHENDPDGLDGKSSWIFDLIYSYFPIFSWQSIIFSANKSLQCGRGKTLHCFDLIGKFSSFGEDFRGQ